MAPHDAARKSCQYNFRLGKVEREMAAARDGAGRSRQTRTAAMQRPTSVTVFGVLNLVFGGFGLLRAFVSLAVMLSTTAQFAETGTVYWGRPGGFPGLAGMLMLLLYLVGGVMEVSSGVGLLRMRRWGRSLAIGYSGVVFVRLAITAVFTYYFVLRPMTERLGVQHDDEDFRLAAVIGAAVGAGVSAIYPSLLWYFMTRRNVYIAFHGGEMQEHGEPEQMPRPVVSDNPYASPSASDQP
jgi:hypothetical protein